MTTDTRSDELVKRLRAMPNFWLKGPETISRLQVGAAWIMMTEPAPLGVEAADLIEQLERERDGWKEREAQAHRLLDIAERESAENRRQADGYYHEAAEGWSKFRAAERELAALREAMKRRGKSMVPEMIALRQELAEAQQDAARWKTVDAMWWAGQIEFDCDDNGRCRIQWEPAESPDRVYLGGSPDAAIDAARKP